MIVLGFFFGFGLLVLGAWLEHKEELMKKKRRKKQIQKHESLNLWEIIDVVF